MKLAEAIDEYIGYKKSLGMLFKSPSVRLKAFLKEVGDVELASITPEHVLKHLDGRVGPTTWAWFAKRDALNAFYRYAINRNYVPASPLPTTLPQKPPKFKAYIYTVDDVRRLLTAADSRHRSDWLLEPHTVRTLLLLLYGTGLRIGEATRLTLGDVDLDQQVLTIRDTKFHKMRLVPLSDDLAQMLRAYLQRAWNNKPQQSDSAFFSTHQGKPILRQTAELVFKRLRTEAGVRRNDGANYQPRLHDFRHTFAVTRLVTWYREGKNVQRLLPHLATYLGHVRINETSHYLSITKELLSEASSCFERYALPESKK